MPLYPQPEDILFYAGKTFTVEWYYTEAGKLPGLDYYNRLDQADQDRLDYVIRYMADNPIGTRLPKTMYRVEDPDNKIYAFKPRSERFFSFTTEGAKIILMNAYHKHSQKMAKHDKEKLDTAIGYRNDYLKRVKEGSYYEKQS